MINGALVQVCLTVGPVGPGTHLVVIYPVLFLASISQAASGCLSISASLEIPLWLRLEPLWLRLEGVPVLTSHRCVSRQPP